MFSNLNATRRCGPTSLGSYYAGHDHDGQVALSSGIQQWTVPYIGDYRIEAIGAARGYGWGKNSSQYRGRGARMIGIFLSAFKAVFSNLDATGRYGPTSLGSYYAGKDNERQVSLSSGIQ